MNPKLHHWCIKAIRPERVRLTEKILGRTDWDAERITAYQEAKLQKMIAHCWQSVPFYREKWQNRIEDPRDIRKLSDLAHLPTLTKDEVRRHQTQMVTNDQTVKMTDARTGGSTGQPIIFKMTPYDEELAWAQMYTGWSWAGYRIGDPFLVIGGESVGVGLSDNRTWKDRVMNRWASSGSNITRARVAALVKQPVFSKLRLIYGYPNAIREFCERLDGLGVRPPQLQGVVCTAEVMRSEVRRRIAEVLGTNRILDQYGANDGGLHACEGPEQDGLYVSFHRGVLELLDDEGAVINRPGKTGKAVATCLTNFAMPFIRYEVGDQIHWHEAGDSTSGIRWQRIGQVDGRTGDVIFLSSGRSIAMPGLTLVMRWFDGLKHYQFIQTGPDQVTARLELEPGIEANEQTALQFLRERIAPEVTWKIEWGPPLLTSNHKLLIIRNDWLRALGLDRPPTA